MTVAATVPLEVTVTDFVTAVPTATLPNDRDVALKLNAGVAAFSCRATAREVLPVVAVSVTDCAVVTEATFAVNVAAVAPAATETVAGTVIELLLLATATFKPPAGAEPDKLTVHESARDPVTEMLLQVIALTTGCGATPAPDMLTVTVGALLVMVMIPV